MRMFLAFLRDLPGAYRLWKAEDQHQARATLLATQLRHVEMLEDIAYHLGTAIGTARNMGIELHIGLSYGDCRAVLPRNRWTRIPSSSAPFEPGQFIVRPIEEVTEVQALDKDLCFAVARCILAAKAGGVIL